MPYFPGFTLVDASGVPIGNGAGGTLREPHASINGIVNGLNVINGIVGPEGVQGTVQDLATRLGVPEEGATIAGQVAGTAAAVAPVAAVILAPELGFAELALAVLGSAYSLQSIYNQQGTQYSTLTANGTYTLANAGGITAQALADAVSLILENIDGAHEDVVQYIAGEAPRQQNLRALVETVYAAVLSVGGDVGDLAGLFGSGDGRYPGPDGVTNGTPVEVTASQVVEQTMDGALLEWTVLPPTITSRGAGVHHSYYNLGFYSFVSSDGYAEDLRWLSWNTHIITPKSMVHAAKLVLYLGKPGCTLSVQPWTLGASE